MCRLGRPTQARRFIAIVVVMTLAAGAFAWADLTLIATSTYELQNKGEHAQMPPGEEQPQEDEQPDMSLPEMLTMQNDLPWAKIWLTEDEWRMDLFELDPRAGASPVFSTIRLEESGRTIMLDWDERIAEISDDAAHEAWGEQMEEREAQEQADFEQNRVETLQQLPPEVLEQMPPEVLEQMPPEVRAQIEQILGGEQEEDLLGEIEGPRPAVTVTIEGPLDTETVLGLACTRYRITTEVRDAGEEAPWGHLREQTVVSLTRTIDPPLITDNPWEWRGAMIMAGMPDEWERAAEGLDIPDGFAMKGHSIIEDLVAGTSGVLSGEIVEYNEDPIAPSVFEIPAGFTVEQMHLQEIGAHDAGEVQP